MIYDRGSGNSMVLLLNLLHKGRLYEDAQVSTIPISYVFPNRNTPGTGVWSPLVSQREAECRCPMSGSKSCLSEASSFAEHRTSNGVAQRTRRRFLWFVSLSVQRNEHCYQYHCNPNEIGFTSGPLLFSKSP